jgi:PAS domain S-box-containing protein
VISAPDLYLAGSAFDPESLMTRIQEEAALARVHGFSGLRFASGAGWRVENLHDPQQLIETECLATDAVQRIGCTTLCPYERPATPPGLLLPVLAAHPIVMMGGEIHDNFLYVRGSSPARDCAALALEAGEQTWRALLNASTDAAVLLDAKGTILACNEATARRFGKPVAELIGTNAYAHLPPEVARTRKLYVDGVVRTGRPAHFEDYRADIYIEHSTYPVFDALGQVRLVASFGRDITARKRAEEALRRSAELFRAIADCSCNWEISRDPEGKLRWASSAGEKITGYTALECSTMPDFPLPIVVEEDRERVAAMVRSAIAERTSGREVPLRIRRKDGAVRWLVLSWQPMYDTQGTYLGIRTSARDGGGEAPPPTLPTASTPERS